MRRRGQKDKDFESNSFTHRRPLVGGKKVVVDLSRFEKWPPPKPVLLSFFLSFLLLFFLLLRCCGKTDRQRQRDRERCRGKWSDEIRLDWMFFVKIFPRSRQSHITIFRNVLLLRSLSRPRGLRSKARDEKGTKTRGNINTQFGSALSLYVTSQKKNAGCLVVVDNAQHLCKMASSSCSAEEKRFEETTTTKEEEVSRGESGGSSRGGGSGRFVEAQ